MLSKEDQKHILDCISKTKQFYKKKEIKNVLVLGYDKKGKHGFGQPFAIAFVYFPHNCIIVKGGSDEVHEWIGSHQKPCVFHMTYWREKNCFSSQWKTSMKNFFIIKEMKKKRPYYVLRIIKTDGSIEQHKVRTMPKKWITFYDKAFQNMEKIENG